ncbi:unnamed protein product [Gadus morhua 'NCC']
MVEACGRAPASVSESDMPREPDWPSCLPPGPPHPSALGQLSAGPSSSTLHRPGRSPTPAGGAWPCWTATGPAPRGNEAGLGYMDRAAALTGPVTPRAPPAGHKQPTVHRAVVAALSDRPARAGPRGASLHTLKTGSRDASPPTSEEVVGLFSPPGPACLPACVFALRESGVDAAAEHCECQEEVDPQRGAECRGKLTSATRVDPAARLKDTCCQMRTFLRLARTLLPCSSAVLQRRARWVERSEPPAPPGQLGEQEFEKQDELKRSAMRSVRCCQPEAEKKSPLRPSVQSQIASQPGAGRHL